MNFHFHSVVNNIYSTMFIIFIIIHYLEMGIIISKRRGLQLQCQLFRSEFDARAAVLSRLFVCLGVPIIYMISSSTFS